MRQCAWCERKQRPAGERTLLFGLLAVSLLPVAVNALLVFHQANAHVIAEMPGFREFEHAIRWSLVLVCGVESI